MWLWKVNWKRTIWTCILWPFAKWVVGGCQSTIINIETRVQGILNRGIYDFLIDQVSCLAI